jgi:DNA ligase (NAD+)
MARCTGGLTCPTQNRRSIEHYTSRKGLDIDGFGEKTVQQLLDDRLLTDIADLYELTVSDVQAMEGFGEQSGEKLVAALDATREPELDDFITALGIREVGPTVARSLAREFQTFNALRTASGSDLQSVTDIGPVTVDRILDFFDSSGNTDVLERLLTHVTPQEV